MNPACHVLYYNINTPNHTCRLGPIIILTMTSSPTHTCRLAPIIILTMTSSAHMCPFIPTAYVTLGCPSIVASIASSTTSIAHAPLVMSRVARSLYGIQPASFPPSTFGRSCMITHVFEGPHSVRISLCAKRTEPLSL